MQIEIDTDRLNTITALAKGAHYESSGEMCVMEAVAWVAREPWSDHPQCACPVIGEFMRSWNDTLPDAERNELLLPLIPRLVGTRGSKVLEERRSLMAADWLVRTHAPAWLRLAGLTVQAEALSSLPEITSIDQLPSIKPAIGAARTDAAAAWNAAWSAVGDATWAAARDATRAAAWGAARDAAGAAALGAARATVLDAVLDAAWAAARDAVWGAAGAAARDAAWDTAWRAAWAAVLDAAWAAAKDAAGAAAKDAAWVAARAAAWDAVGYATWAAAPDAARDAARDAALGAAWDATWATLADTKRDLQKSALALVERMIEAKER